MITRAGQVALVVAGWLVLLSLVARFSTAAPMVVVMFPGGDLMDHLPDGTAITGRSAISVTLRTDDPGLVAQLYAAGAWLVLPAGLTGCIAPQRT